LAVAAERALPVPVRRTQRWPVLLQWLQSPSEMLSAWFGEQANLNYHTLPHSDDHYDAGDDPDMWSTSVVAGIADFSGQAQFERHLLFIALSGLLVKRAG
jgi:hypothetical protein